jgi:hypothetical protein
VTAAGRAAIAGTAAYYRAVADRLERQAPTSQMSAAIGTNE